MNRAILSLLDLLASLFRRAGVDYYQLRAIVDVKLTMDNRRSRTTLGGQEKKDNNWGFLATLGITLLMASGIALLVFFLPSPMAAYSVVAAYTIVVITMILITDFSQVILDSSDNAIILARPVSDKTLFASRLVHAAVYLLQLTLACILPSVFVTLVKYGILPGFVLLLAGLISTFLALIATTIFYLLILRFASPERMQNIINTVQIVVVFAIMGGYQVVLRMYNFGAIFDNPALLTFAWWHYFLPPLWVGYVMEAAVSRTFSVHAAACIFLLLSVPAAAIWAINSGLLQNFGSHVGSMDTASKEPETPSATNQSLSERLAPFFTRTATERGSFEMVWKITSRDRKFKLRVYPSMAYFAIIGPLLLLNKSITGFDQFMDVARESDFTKFMMIYLSSLIIASVNQNVVFSEQFKAAWVYHMTSLSTPGEILNGRMWAMFVKFMIPVYIFLGVVISYVWGVGSLADVAFGAMVGLIFQQVELLTFRNALPFTREFTKNSGGQFVRLLAMTIFVGILGWIHWALSQTSYVIPVLLLLALGLVLFLNKEIRRLGWEKVAV